MRITLILILFNWFNLISGQFDIPIPSELSSFDDTITRIILLGTSKKEWEGPYAHDVLVTGTAVLPCIQQSKTERHLEKIYQQARTGITQMAILWVHQAWDNVVDPWLGDGRRSYDTLHYNAYWSSSLSPNFNQTALHISDVEQPDNGVYACVVIKYALELQISPIILDKAELISVHLLRVRSGFVVAPGCEPEKAAYLQFCRTGFEKWTFHVYYPVGRYTGDFLFKAQCHGDAFLTGLALGHLSPTLWSVGWRFVPYGETDNSTTISIEPRSAKSLVAPVELCIPDGPRLCSTEQEANPIQQQQQQQDYMFSQTNLQAAYSSTLQLWRARWLLLVGSQPQESGVWQCWVQGVAATDRNIINRKIIRFLMSEYHVHIIREEQIYEWWRTVEVWRFLLLLTAPLTLCLGFIVFCVSWMAAKLYADRLPPTASQDINYKAGFYSISQRRVEGPFNSEKYMKRYLTKSGIEAYHREFQFFKPRSEINKGDGR